MSEGRVRFCVEDGVARIVFDRPDARNAMTWAMYDALIAACDLIAANPDVRLAVMQGAGGAFISGTDIAQFTEFGGTEDGIAYEARIEAVIGRVDSVPVPMIALIDGWCTGGGLIIASACDIRLATPASRFAVPIARTLGNCLSIRNVARLVAAFGVARTKRMLMLAETIGAEEAQACGFVARIAAADVIESETLALCAKLKAHAPLTVRAAKEAIRRVTLGSVPAGDDLVRLCYGSDDFHEGVDAFLAKRRPEWRGR
jgi:enoyl-CoA hydratase